jgi:hypothetical protein
MAGAIVFSELLTFTPCILGERERISNRLAAAPTDRRPV